jgi:hypothetical protein
MTMNAGCDNSAAGRCAMMVVAALAMMAVGPVELALGQIPCRYELVATIQGPNCAFTGPAYLQPMAISPNGLYVTGWYQQCAVTADEAFLWIGPPPGVRVTITRPPGIESAKGYDVNDDGVVTGMCYQSGAMRGFVYKRQSNQWITLSPSQPNGEVQPSAINNAGTVVGYRSIRNNTVPREAFLWNESTGFEGLGVMIGPSSGAGDISEDGIVVGWTGANHADINQSTTRGFVHQNGVTTILGPVPGGTSSEARGVSELGQLAVVGKTQSTPVTLYRSFIYEAGVMSGLPIPVGYDRGFAEDVTNVGLAYSACSNSSNGQLFNASVWLDGDVAILKYRISPIPWNPNTSHYVADALENGTLLIGGRNATGSNGMAFIIRPLPQSPDDPKCCSFPGDANCDQIINIDDLVQVITHWGPCQACPADFDHNNQVNIDDLVTVITHWSP